MLNRAKILKDYWCPQEIDWRFYAVVVKVSTVFVLIINGEFALNGMRTMPTMLK